MMAELSSDDDSDENSRHNNRNKLSNNNCISKREINPFCMDLTQGIFKYY